MRETEDDAAQIVEISGHAIHAVTNDGVAFAYKGKHGLELGPLDIFAGSFVGKCSLVHGPPSSCRARILVDGAHPYIADPVTRRGRLLSLC